jgi:hypothetical protein
MKHKRLGNDVLIGGKYPTTMLCIKQKYIPRQSSLAGASLHLLNSEPHLLVCVLQIYDEPSTALLRERRLAVVLEQCLSAQP